MIAGMSENAIPIIDIVTRSSKGRVTCSIAKCPSLSHGKAKVTVFAAER